MLKRLTYILVAGLVMAGTFGLMFWVHRMFVLGKKPYLALLFIGIYILFVIPGIILGVSWLRWKIWKLFAVGSACWLWWALGWCILMGHSTVTIEYREIYYIVRGFPYLLYPPLAMLVYTGIYYLLEKRVRVNRGLARLHFWVTLFGLWFVMLSATNEWVAGMPRRYSDSNPVDNLVYQFLLVNGLIGAVSYTHLTLPTTPYV